MCDSTVIKTNCAIMHVIMYIDGLIVKTIYSMSVLCAWLVDCEKLLNAAKVKDLHS